MITYAEFLAMSEAVRLAEAGGVSVEQLREVGRSNGVVNETMYQFIVNRNKLSESCTESQMAEIFGVFGNLGEKDLDCAISSADDMNVSIPSTQALRKVIYDLFVNKC